MDSSRASACPPGRGGIARAAPGRSGGFTLVEMLVVVALIGLLVTVIAPSLGRAREMGFSTMCKSNLRQLWEAIQVSGTGGDSVRLPAPEVWVGTVRERGAGGALRCPKDRFLEEAADLAEVVAVQYHYQQEYYHGSPREQVWEYPMEDMLAGLPLFQLKVTQPSSDVLLFNWANHSILQVTLGSDMELRSLMGPGRGGCISEMYVLYRGQQVMRLTGENYARLDPPFYVKGEEVSYAMNERAETLPSRPDQVLLVEYEKTIAREDDDLERWLGTGRHFGNQLNVICVDGRCRTVEDGELKPSSRPLWLP